MILKKYLFFVFTFVMGLLAFSVNVAAQEAAAVKSELRRTSVVVVSHPEFSLSKSKTFAWSDNYADVSGALKKTNLPVQTLIDVAIKKALTAKGYRHEPKTTDSMLIQYHVSLESEMDDTALAVSYGLAPGLRANQAQTKKYERGTLIVDIINPSLKKVMWRGAIGVFTGLEATDEARQARVNQLVAELFGNIPAIN